MADFIVIVVLAVVIGGAVAYMVKQKKRGARCIGCSSGGCCSGSCNCHNEKK